jgi:hypothetical protein
LRDGLSLSPRPTPSDDRLSLPRQSIDANRQAHRHIDCAQGWIVLLGRMPDRGESLCQQRLELAGSGLVNHHPALR